MARKPAEIPPSAESGAIPPTVSGPVVELLAEAAAAAVAQSVHEPASVNEPAGNPPAASKSVVPAAAPNPAETPKPPQDVTVQSAPVSAPEPAPGPKPEPAGVSLPIRPATATAPVTPSPAVAAPLAKTPAPAAVPAAPTPASAIPPAVPKAAPVAAAPTTPTPTPTPLPKPAPVAAPVAAPAANVAASITPAAVPANQSALASPMKIFAQETMMSTTDEMLSFGHANVDAALKTGQVLASGLQEITRTLAESAQAQFDHTIGTFKALAGTKSLKEAVDIQQVRTRAALERVMSDTGRLADVSMKLAEQAWAPLTARFQAVTDRAGRAV